MPDSPFPQPLCRSSLVFLLVLDHLLHTSYISSPNHHLLFATHAHTIAASVAVVPMLCHLLRILIFTFITIFDKNVEFFSLLRAPYMSRNLTTCRIQSINNCIGPRRASRVRSKLKVQNSRTFKDPNCIFQAPKLSTKSHILDADIQNLDCNVTLKCTVLYSPIL